jgi:hypothetical protein
MSSKGGKVGSGTWPGAGVVPYVYISDPGVVSFSPVSSQVFRPERIMGQPP